ncbi:MAG: transporter [Bacteroidetes bacterium]|nr:transporter [Bacteroidota bacterium]
MRLKSLLLVLIVIASVNLFGQTFVTDRPDYTESALVIVPGMVQLEMGVGYSEMGDLSVTAYPNLLARIGVVKNLEVRVGFPGWITPKVGDNSETYLNDLLFEAKYQISKKRASVPMAILLIMTLPSGDDEVSSGSPNIGAKFAASFDLNNQFSVGANVGAVSVEANDEREILVLGSVNLGMSISNKLGAFVEVFAEAPGNKAWAPMIDGGFTFLITPTNQLDFYAGTGLNDYGPDFIIGGGFSTRFGW